MDHNQDNVLLYITDDLAGQKPPKTRHRVAAFVLVVALAIISVPIVLFKALYGRLVGS